MKKRGAVAEASPQQLELVSEVWEAYSIAFEVAEPEKRTYWQTC